MSLVGLWTGLLGAAVVASRLAARGAMAGRGTAACRAMSGASGALGSEAGTGSIVRDYGLELRPWPDIPLGIVAGVASQYLLVPVVEAPLLPFVHHLYTRLGHPAQTLTGGAYGPGLVVLAVLVCVGSPIVEELFFRGLVLRALVGSFTHLGARLGPALSIVITALVFALGALRGPAVPRPGGLRDRAGLARMAHGPARAVDRGTHDVQHSHDHRHSCRAMSPE